MTFTATDSDTMTKRETRLANAFTRYMEEHGSDKAIFVIQKILAQQSHGNRKTKTRQAR